jgi:hypothetical protein
VGVLHQPAVGVAVAAAGFGLVAAGALLLSRLAADAQVLVDLLPGLLLAATGLGAGFVTATTAMARIDHAQAGLASGLLSTGHQLGASLGWRSSRRSPAPAWPAPGAAGPRGAGFGQAFLACAVVAAVAAVAAPWLLPPGRPPDLEPRALATRRPVAVAGLRSGSHNVA